MDITRQITVPTPNLKFKQQLSFATAIAATEIAAILKRIEYLDRIDVPLSTMDMAEKDTLYERMKIINLKIAIITNIALDGL